VTDDAADRDEVVLASAESIHSEYACLVLPVPTEAELQLRIAPYLVSSRRLPFNEQGIFRHGLELDQRAPERVGSAGKPTPVAGNRRRSTRRASRR
jgi:hypothetical protein